MHPRSGRRKLSQTIRRWALSMTCGAKAATLKDARKLQLPVGLIGDPQEEVAYAPEMPAEVEGLPQAEEFDLVEPVYEVRPLPSRIQGTCCSWMTPWKLCQRSSSRSSRGCSAARSALTSTAWRTATLPGCAATACAGTLPERLCWAPSGALLV